MMPTRVDTHADADRANMGTSSNAAVAGMDTNSGGGVTNMGTGIHADIPSIGCGSAQQRHCENRKPLTFSWATPTVAGNRALAGE